MHNANSYYFFSDLYQTIFTSLKRGWSRSDRDLSEDREEVKSLYDDMQSISSTLAVEFVVLIKPSGVFNQTEMLYQLTKNAETHYQRLVEEHLDQTFNFTILPRAAKYKAELKKELKKLAIELRKANKEKK